MAVTPTPPQTPNTPAGFRLDIRWIGALFVLWVVLTALATLEDTRDLAVALAWLVAISALFYAIDPSASGLNALAATGL